MSKYPNHSVVMNLLILTSLQARNTEIFSFIFGANEPFGFYWPLANFSDFIRYFENWIKLKTLFETKPPFKMLIKIFPRKLETCLQLSKNSPNQCTTKKPETTQSAHQSSNSIPYRFLKRRGLSQKLTIKSCVQDWF